MPDVWREIYGDWVPQEHVLLICMVLCRMLFMVVMASICSASFSHFRMGSRCVSVGRIVGEKLFLYTMRGEHEQHMMVEPLPSSRCF